MWPFHPELLARAVPRYTSYPTAAEFGASVGGADQLAALRSLPHGTFVSLYVHIPFCRDICWYCGCNTNRANRTDRIVAYLEAVEAEINWLASHLSGRVSLSRISFGGGSPNALDPLSFVRLVSQIVTAFQASTPEISVELDPRTLDAEWAGLLGKIGATRASLGVQTLDAEIQARIGRVQPLEMIRSSVDLLRKSGVTSLNFDLMYGLPGQSEAILMDTLEGALQLAPDRIALFGYAHVPHLIPRQRRIEASELPGLEQRFQQAALGHERLVSAGLQPIGFDHFAQPSDPIAVAAREGRLRRNFQGFTDDQAPALLGIGATAISATPDLIVQNEKNTGRYRMRVLGGQPAAELGVRRSADDQERGLVIEDLLCGRSADLSGLPEDGDCELRLKPFLEAGLCQLENDRLTILPGGLPYSRAIAACFDSYRAQGAGRFSSAV
ncbi:oxygen-independent coproporphyrinogen III oxidase [Sandaracinobacter neustonicus]|uniref:Coproporphyrinogen-III oxidase n=1 Tax=Sandaracinobacter neustonicus TaxID=1715348 RepID=A0A501XPN6_9SPHN|nr:oxygen-independent coproporphyrinogen III oxidase [Sandaracinobacter neustonicus]TPE62214.1 oxygen-independent coproporphyrinogen III oxidase [Sandaracinobacter neustonicus]